VVSRGRVMVIEDEEGIRKLVQMVLSNEGYDVLTASDGRAALDLVGWAQPDLIFLDMYMPVMDGWQFSRAYRKTPGPHRPVIILTAGHNPALVAAQVLADSYLPKPFDVDDLILLASQYTERRPCLV